MLWAPDPPGGGDSPPTGAPTSCQGSETRRDSKYCEAGGCGAGVHCLRRRCSPAPGVLRSPHPKLLSHGSGPEGLWDIVAPQTVLKHHHLLVEDSADV